jgi:hypothetical protein
VVDEEACDDGDCDVDEGEKEEEEEEDERGSKPSHPCCSCFLTDRRSTPDQKKWVGT